MSEFPFDGLDLVPTPSQAKMIARFRELVTDHDLPEPDVIQPRPTNPHAIEVFWIESKLCVVFEDDEEISQMERAWARPDEAEAA